MIISGSPRTCQTAALTRPICYNNPCQRKIRDALQELQQDGWFPQSQKGSHRQLEHPFKPGKLTVAGHPSDELDDSAWRRLKKTGGLKIKAEENSYGGYDDYPGSHRKGISGQY